MKQYEPCIQNNNNKKIKRIKMKKEKEKGGGGRQVGEKRAYWERDFLFFLFSSLLSQIYRNRTVRFRQSKRQS